MDNIIDYEAIEKLAESIREFAKRLGEIISEIAEKLGEFLKEYKEKANKPKYKFIKSLIKPYKQPFIKVRYRARANL
jgi:hypothetical protein